MNVLVTGASGFTGSHLVERLVADGHRVRALSRKGSNTKLLEKLDVEIVEGDLEDPATLAPSVRDIHTVYHIAAFFRQEGVGKEIFWKVNAEAVGHLLEDSIRYGVRRFVHCSTVGIHGHIEDPPGNEDSPHGPGDLYQTTKLEGELIAQRYLKSEKIGVTIFRPVGIYGPRDLRFLKLFRAIKRRRFLMLGSGRVSYHFTFIDDLVDGIVLCGTREEAVGNVYILGGEEYVSLNELASMIADEVGVPRPKWRIPIWPVYAAGFLCEVICKPLGLEPPLYRRRVDFFRKNRAFDISRAKSDLDYQPQVGLKEGIRRTAAWYAENGYL